MKLIYLESGIKNIEINTIYLNQKIGEDDTAVFDNVNYPAKTFNKALNMVKNSPINRLYKIYLLEDYIIDSPLILQDIRHNILITSDTNNKKGILGCKVIPTQLYNIDSDILSFLVETLPEGLIIKSNINGIISELAKPICEYLDIRLDVNNLIELKLSDISVINIDIEGNPVKGLLITFTLPSQYSANLDSDAFILTCLAWNCTEYKLISYDKQTRLVVALTRDLVSWLYNNHTILRIFNNSADFKPGTYKYEKVANGYKIYYKLLPSESILGVLIPILENVITVHASSNITFTNLIFKNNYNNRDRFYSSQGFKEALGYITVTNSSNINFINNEFTKCAGHCIRIQNWSKFCTIKNNYFHDILGGAIFLGNTENNESLDGNYKKYPNCSHDIIIDNNLIKGWGNFKVSACAIFAGPCHDIIISNNTICDGFYTALSIGYFLGSLVQNCYNNYIGYNHIHHCMNLILNDGGAIYINGKQRDTIVEYNHVHDIYSRNYGNEGPIGCCLYGENGISNTLFRYNVCYSANVITHCFTENNVIVNNVLAFPTESIMEGWPMTTKVGAFFFNNLIKTTKLLDKYNINTHSIYFNNIIDAVDNNTLLSKVNNNVNTHIYFTDAAHGDFTIKDKTYNHLLVNSNEQRNYNVDIYSGFIYNVQNKAGACPGEDTAYTLDNITLSLTFNYTTKSGVSYTEISYSTFYKLVTMDLHNVNTPYLLSL